MSKKKTDPAMMAARSLEILRCDGILRDMLGFQAVNGNSNFYRMPMSLKYQEILEKKGLIRTKRVKKCGILVILTPFGREVAKKVRHG